MLSSVVDRSWYNPNREYWSTMVPSLVGTLTMTTVLMVIVMSVARERELGTFEQLLVSPLLPVEIIIGKAVPGADHRRGGGDRRSVILVTLVFGIPLTGSIFVLYAGLIVFLLAIIGVALFISSLVSTQQQAMLGAMVYMMPAMMLSGFASPVQNMPDWLQPVAQANPLTHFLVIVRGVFLRDMPMALVARADLADADHRDGDAVGRDVAVPAAGGVMAAMRGHRQNALDGTKLEQHIDHMIRANYNGACRSLSLSSFT